MSALLDLAEQQRRDLTVHWDEFADADPLSHHRELDAFLHDMESAGFAQWAPVDDDALEEPFAWERGIEPGGMMWELTALGRTARAQALLHQAKGEG